MYSESDAISARSTMQAITAGADDLRKCRAEQSRHGTISDRYTVLTVESFSSFAIYFENYPFIYFVLPTE